MLVLLPRVDEVLKEGELFLRRVSFSDCCGTGGQDGILGHAKDDLALLEDCWFDQYSQPHGPLQMLRHGLRTPRVSNAAPRARRFKQPITGERIMQHTLRASVSFGSPGFLMISAAFGRSSQVCLTMFVWCSAQMMSAFGRISYWHSSSLHCRIRTPLFGLRPAGAWSPGASLPDIAAPLPSAWSGLRCELYKTVRNPPSVLRPPSLLGAEQQSIDCE